LKKPAPTEKDFLFRACLKAQLAKATIGLHGVYLVGEHYVVSVGKPSTV